MKTVTTNIGNVTLVVNRSENKNDPLVLLGQKRPKDKRDAKRKRKRIGVGLFVPPGGATEKSDKSQKHSAQRELVQETGIFFPLKSFQKVGILHGFTDSTGVQSWLVHIYLVETSRSDLALRPNREYVEMRWFPLSKLPLSKMLQGDKEWLPQLVRGKKLSITLIANQNADKAFSLTCRPVSSFN